MDRQTETKGTQVFVCPELARWIDAFLTAKQSEGTAPGTIKYYRDKLLPFTNYLLSKSITTPETISAPVIRDYIIELQTRHNPGGCHAAYRAIRAFLLWFENESAPDDWRNPIRKCKPPKVPEEILNPVPLEDVRAMISKAAIRDKAILFTLLDAGLRAGELLALDLADFDTFSGELKIRKSKSRKPRIVFVGVKTRRAIRGWLKTRGAHPGALFQTRTGERLTYSGLRQIIRRLAVKAGIREWSLHSFRRACALNLLRSGADILTVSRILGHTTLDVLRRYVKQTSGDLQAAYRSPVDGLGGDR
jgi:integrase/recombinase XerD